MGEDSMIPSPLDAIEIQTDEAGKWVNLPEILPKIKDAASRAGVPLDEALAKIKKVKAGNGNGSAVSADNDAERMFRENAQREMQQRRNLESATMIVDMTKSLIELRSIASKTGFQKAVSMLDKKIDHMLHLIDMNINPENAQ